LAKKRPYSDHRPDVAALFAAPDFKTLLADLKLFDPIGSDGAPDLRGAMVGFGNTLPLAQRLVYGLAERGTPSGGPFKPRTGGGHVAYVKGDYATSARREGNGCQPLAVLIETFGGFSPELVWLFERLAQERMNRLTHLEYDQTTWAARSWTAFSAQKLSVAVHLAMATEVAVALGLPVAGDHRATRALPERARAGGRRDGRFFA
jgi:hypothetical protein